MKQSFSIYFSEVNETELILAPQHIREVKTLIPNDCLTFIEMSDEVETLAQTYITKKHWEKRVKMTLII